MDVLTAIAERRATRSYTDEVVERATVERLIETAVHAPSARDLEPWAFVVLDGRERLRGFSEEVKRELLRAAEAGMSAEVRKRLSDPSYEIFYGAPVLIVICATSTASQAAEDCCLAAQNFMLAAHAEGLATCPIGFARAWLNLPETKREIGIPPEYVPVFPLILGHSNERPASPGRRPPRIQWL